MTHNRTQQAAGPGAVGEPPAASALATGARSWLVQDEGVAASGQMSHAAFVARLRPLVTGAADAELGRVGRSTQDCPYLQRWLGWAEGLSAAGLEEAVRRYSGAGADGAEAALAAISVRVQQSVRTWVRSGQLDLPGDLSALGGTGASVSSGRPLEGGLRHQMERRFQTSFADVRVHEGAPRSGIAETMGEDIRLSPAATNLDPQRARVLMGHELAHVAQQRRGGSGGTESLERDADEAAMVASGTTERVVESPLGAPLGLQACELERAPENLEEMTVRQRASYIEGARAEDRLGAGDAIVETFQRSAEAGDFQLLVGELDMPALLEGLEPWDAVRIGAAGAIGDAGAAAVLAQKQMEMIRDGSHDYGLARGQVFALYIFNHSQDDQIRRVLTLLCEDNRYKDTVGSMTTVKEGLAARGIDLSAYQDRAEGIGDFFRGVGTAISDFFGSSEAARSGTSSRYFGQQMEMPENYQRALQAIDEEEFRQALRPGNVVLGMADYVTFGVVSGAYGLVAGTVNGVGSLLGGELDAAGRELFPALLVVGTCLGARMVVGRRGGTPAPARAGQVITVDEAIAALSAEAQVVARSLRATLGDAAILRAAQILQADSRAAALVQRHGAPGLRAIVDAEGDIVRATALLVERVEVATVQGVHYPPTTRGGGWHGTHEVPPAVAFEQGLPARGTNVDLINHVEAGGGSAFRGTTPFPMSPDRQAGAALWAGEGGFVYDVRGVPTWDTNALLQGRRPVAGGLGGYGGNLMAGEIESAIPARVPRENIAGAYPVLEGRGGSLRLGDYIPNPNFVEAP